MMQIDYNSKESIKSCLQENGLRLSKRFGQNFLLSEHHRIKIVKSLDVKPEETVWEIGPGIGALTHHLVQYSGLLKAFEIDRGFIPVLNELFGSYSNFSLIEGDFLKTWREELEHARPIKIIGNLPYSVGSIIIGDLIKNDVPASLMIFTLQKEVVDRITAVPGSKEYSAFSMICQYQWNCKKILTLPKNVFFPVPDVTSACLKMKRDTAVPIVSRGIYDTLVNDLFISRRKMISNNIKLGKLKERYSLEDIYIAFDRAGVSIARRGETVTVLQAVEICRYLAETMTHPSNPN